MTIRTARARNSISPTPDETDSLARRRMSLRIHSDLLFSSSRGHFSVRARRPGAGRTPARPRNAPVTPLWAVFRSRWIASTSNGSQRFLSCTVHRPHQEGMPDGRSPLPDSAHRLGGGAGIRRDRRCTADPYQARGQARDGRPAGRAGTRVPSGGSGSIRWPVRDDQAALIRRLRAGRRGPLGLAGLSLHGWPVIPGGRGCAGRRGARKNSRRSTAQPGAMLNRGTTSETLLPDTCPGGACTSVSAGRRVAGGGLENR
jgi:hypothetical protein